MQRKKIVPLMLLFILFVPLNACSSVMEQASPQIPSALSSDSNHGENIGITTTITLNGDTISVEGYGVAVNESIATITSAGLYTISGSLRDGQIIVDTQDEGEVELILNGIDISFSKGSPIYILNAGDCIMTLAEESQNIVTDNDSYIFDEEETNKPDAAIFSNSDLTIRGSGSLNVYGNYQHGIVSKDDLDIEGGTINVTATSDGMQGKDSIEISDGTLTIQAGGDGMQSSNDTDAQKGFILIEGGILNIQAGLDGIQTETDLSIHSGVINIISGGGSASCISEIVNFGEQRGDGNGNGMSPYQLAEATNQESSKGLKAGTNLVITGGTFEIDACDDAMHANENITLENGEVQASSGDDGMHADSNLEILGGSLMIQESYEGIESANISIEGGSVSIVSKDDGINVAGGNDGSAFNGRAMQQDDFNLASDQKLVINGGLVNIDSGGDGIDVNGSIEMGDGRVIIHGPVNNANGALDYLGTFDICGGLLIAVGSSGMAQAPSISSTQYTVLYNFSDMQTPGSLLHIESQDGQDILTFNPSKNYQSVLISSPLFEKGKTYQLYSGGNVNGTNENGLYADGNYSDGAQVISFTISEPITRLGSSSEMPGGQGGRRGEPGGQGGMQPPMQ